MCGHCSAHTEFREAMDNFIDAATMIQPCAWCNEVHKMALTTFPDEDGWPCPWDASKEAFAKRVEIVIKESTDE